MSVYVDDAMIPFHRMKMSHMIADTIPELLEMADKIGIARHWIQDKGSCIHFDVCLSKRELAIEKGAVALPFNKYVVKMREIRERKGGPGVPVQGDR